MNRFCDWALKIIIMTLVLRRVAGSFGRRV
jgi:hypothetical protein